MLEGANWTSAFNILAQTVIDKDGPRNSMDYADRLNSGWQAMTFGVFISDEKACFQPQRDESCKKQGQESKSPRQQ